MKKLIIIILILKLNILSAQMSQDTGWLFVPTTTIPEDKQTHAAAGMFLAATGYAFTYGITKGNRRKSVIVGIAAPTLIGLAKEIADNQPGGTGFDSKDLLYTAASGVVVSFSLDFIVGRKNRRNKH